MNRLGEHGDWCNSTHNRYQFNIIWLTQESTQKENNLLTFRKQAHLHLEERFPSHIIFLTSGCYHFIHIFLELSNSWCCDTGGKNNITTQQNYWQKLNNMLAIFVDTIMRQIKQSVKLLKTGRGLDVWIFCRELCRWQTLK